MRATPLELAIEAVVDLLMGSKTRPPAVANTRICRACNADVAMLHHDPDRPDDPHRTVCGACQGERNRRIVGTPNSKHEAPHETARKGKW